MNEDNGASMRNLIIVATLGIILLVGFGIALVRVSSDSGEPIVILLTLGAMVVLGGIGLILRYMAVGRARRKLDEAFSLTGFEPVARAGKVYYRGAVHMQSIEVFQSGTQLMLTVEAPVGVRARIQTWSGSVRQLEDPELAHLYATAADGAWLDDLLQDWDAREAILGLLGAGPPPGQRSASVGPVQVHVQSGQRSIRFGPGRILVQVGSLGTVSAEEIRYLLYHAADLANAAERLQPAGAAHPDEDRESGYQLPTAAEAAAASPQPYLSMIVLVGLMLLGITIAVAVVLMAQ